MSPPSEPQAEMNSATTFTFGIIRDPGFVIRRLLTTDPRLLIADSLWLYFVSAKLNAVPPPVIEEIQTLENLGSFGASFDSLKARA